MYIAGVGGVESGRTVVGGGVILKVDDAGRRDEFGVRGGLVRVSSVGNLFVGGDGVLTLWDLAWDLLFLLTIVVLLQTSMQKDVVL
jgi:hypothetical protein